MMNVLDNPDVPPALTYPASARWDIVDFIQALISGDTGAWIALAAIAGCIVFFVLYKRVTGQDFVKSRKERRAARRRRKRVVWEYEPEE